ncbi:hypothetical protein [Caulobacter henricii]|uniref:hypothetical protein n=1 Tax=Caulobacter henricii TaxID=69395 RepID=UPI000A8B82CF|nr:hypothetical protein [Caulobacter henricii]
MISFLCRLARAASPIFAERGSLKAPSKVLQHAYAGGIAIALVWASVASAQIDTAGAKLKERGVIFDVDDHENIRAAFKTSTKGRGQQVFINRETKPLLGINIRTIWSPVAQIGNDKLGGPSALRLLENNGGASLGYWAILDNYLCFIVKIDDSIDAETLHFLMVNVGEVADKKQMEISGERDEF